MSLIKKSHDLLNPWSDFFDVDRFFGEGWNRKMHSMPSVNIKETDKEFKIELAASGMQKSDFKLNIEDDVLTISAEKKEEKKDENEKYTRREFSYNSFSRSFSLPPNVDADSTNAAYDNGILTITLPKKAVEQKKNGREINVG